MSIFPMLIFCLHRIMGAIAVKSQLQCSVLWIPRSSWSEKQPSAHLNYYQGYNTITQNSAGDIVFECLKGRIRIFASKYYKVDFLDYENYCSISGFYYLGTLNLS